MWYIYAGKVLSLRTLNLKLSLRHRNSSWLCLGPTGEAWTSQWVVSIFRGAAGKGEVCLGGTPLEELREAKGEVPRKAQVQEATGEGRAAGEGRVRWSRNPAKPQEGICSRSGQSEQKQVLKQAWGRVCLGICGGQVECSVIESKKHSSGSIKAVQSYHQIVRCKLILLTP